MKIETLQKRLESSKDGKHIIKTYHGDILSFKNDVEKYIKAIKQGRMICTIHGVSKSGMSRVISFHSCEGYKGRYSYRQYIRLFDALGYRAAGNWAHRISGCGMDMIFHANYCNIHKFKSLGFITSKTCNDLAQKTPVSS